MAIDSSIYQNIGRGVKSVNDYEAEASQAKQNKLAEMVSGMKMDEYTRGVADENQTRELTRKSGGDMNKLSQLLYGAGNYKQGAAIDKTIAEQSKFKDDSAKTQAEVLDKSLSTFRSYVPQINTPEAAGQYVAAMFDHPVLGKFAANFGTREEVIKRNMEGFAKDPRAWMVGSAGVTADKLLETLKGTRQNVNLGNVSQGTTTNYYGEVVPGQTTKSPIGQSADSVASVAQQERNSKRVDERSRESTAATLTKPFEITGEDGKPVLVQQDKQGNIKPVAGYGPKQGASKPMTEGQAKALQFGSRMQATEDVFTELEKSGVLTSTPGARSGFGIGSAINATQSADRQRLDQAKRDFINAILRRESGAAIGKDEFDSAEKQYFPQIGETDPKVIAQKRANRERSTRGVLAEVPDGENRVKTISQPGTAKTVVRTGMHNGKKVVQYSDGSTDYAD